MNVAVGAAVAVATSTNQCPTLQKSGPTPFLQNRASPSLFQKTRVAGQVRPECQERNDDKTPVRLERLTMKPIARIAKSVLSSERRRMRPLSFVNVRRADQCTPLLDRIWTVQCQRYERT